METVSLHRPIVPKWPKHRTWSPEPNVWCPNVPHDLHPSCPADASRLRRPTHHVRSAGAAIEDLLLEGIYGFYNSGRSSMELGKTPLRTKYVGDL